MRKPVVELAYCILCGVCEEVSPTVFRIRNQSYVEVVDLDIYPEPEINEAIKYCPKDCIFWEE